MEDRSKKTNNFNELLMSAKPACTEIGIYVMASSVLSHQLLSFQPGDARPSVE